MANTSDRIVQSVNMLNTTLPNILNIVLHYNQMAEAGKVTDPHDVETMRKNLEALRLPDWDSI